MTKGLDKFDHLKGLKLDSLNKNPFQRKKFEKYRKKGLQNLSLVLYS